MEKAYEKQTVVLDEIKPNESQLLMEVEEMKKSFGKLTTLFEEIKATLKFCEDHQMDYENDCNEISAIQNECDAVHLDEAINLLTAVLDTQPKDSSSVAVALKIAQDALHKPFVDHTSPKCIQLINLKDKLSAFDQNGATQIVPDNITVNLRKKWDLMQGSGPITEEQHLEMIASMNDCMEKLVLDHNKLQISINAALLELAASVGESFEYNTALNELLDMLMD